jgi:hypothetical protein
MSRMSCWGREGIDLYACREGGRFAKWDEPIGVGDAVAI